MTMSCFSTVSPGQEVVVLAGEAGGLAADVGQQRQVVAEQGLRGGRGDPVGALVGQVHPLVPLLDVVRAEARPLQVLPVDLEVLAAPVDAVAQLPEVAVFPGRVGRHAPGAEGAPVVGQVHGEDRVPLVESARAQVVGVVPAVPEVAGPELLGLPAQVRLLRLADLEGPVAEELRVPLGQAELPRHRRAAERPLALGTSRGTSSSPR